MKNKLILSLLCSVSLANIVNAEMVEPVGLQYLQGQAGGGQQSGENIFMHNNIKHDKSINNNIKESISINNQLTPQQIEALQIQQQQYIDPQQIQISPEEIELMKKAIRHQNLKALQNKFFEKKRTGFENVLTIPYEENKTQSIRTRFAMNTTLIFDTKIKSYILGDPQGYKVQEIPNMPNALAITPSLIGIDTNLTIFTEDNKLHNFYIFSTDYKNRQNPNLIVYIKDEEAMLYEEELKRQKAEESKNYLLIQEGIAKVKIRKDEIKRKFKQKAKDENKWLLAEDIFRDNKWTYFKYSKDKMPKIPTIFAVIDKKDTPVETKIIGDYIIAETINPKFTIYIGDSYICVEDLNKKEEKLEKPQKNNYQFKSPNIIETKEIKGK